MYERFTDRARKVMQLANQEAQRFNHEYIGTEHVLLGLVEEGGGVGVNVLRNLGADVSKIRREIERIVQSGPDSAGRVNLPLMPRAKKIIEHAVEESHKLNHNHIGTEHLLLGIFQEGEGVAAQVLSNLGLRLEEVREEMLNLLGQDADLTEDELNPSDDAARNFPALRSASRALDAVFRFLEEKKEAAVAGHQFEWAARLRDLTDELRKQLKFRTIPRRGPKAICTECDFYIPLRYKDGTPVDDEHLARIRQHLADEFGGFVELRQHAEGFVQLANVSFQGDIAVYRVFIEPAEGDRQYLRRLKEELKSHLGQEEIVVAYRTVYLI